MGYDVQREKRRENRSIEEEDGKNDKNKRNISGVCSYRLHSNVHTHTHTRRFELAHTCAHASHRVLHLSTWTTLRRGTKQTGTRHIRKRVSQKQQQQHHTHSTHRLDKHFIHSKWLISWPFVCAIKFTCIWLWCEHWALWAVNRNHLVIFVVPMQYRNRWMAFGVAGRTICFRLCKLRLSARFSVQLFFPSACVCMRAIALRFRCCARRTESAIRCSICSGLSLFRWVNIRLPWTNAFFWFGSAATGKQRGSLHHTNTKMNARDCFSGFVMRIMGNEDRLVCASNDGES